VGAFRLVQTEVLGNKGQLAEEPKENPRENPRDNLGKT
jgi:hypothetical protein